MEIQTLGWISGEKARREAARIKSVLANMSRFTNAAERRRGYRLTFKKRAGHPARPSEHRERSANNLLAIINDVAVSQAGSR